ncbi:MAG: hypothetical protein CM15mP112_06670 [Flavobacteriales bacterium]|nr:MAG: hypothetical protein CM15mP112_06670 [Flavobacteriales bacterium]
MRFWRGVVRQAGFNSNPFTEPLNLPSNIDGGLGYGQDLVQLTTKFQLFKTPQYFTNMTQNLKIYYNFTKKLCKRKLKILKH